MDMHVMRIAALIDCLIIDAHRSLIEKCLLQFDMGGRLGQLGLELVLALLYRPLDLGIVGRRVDDLREGRCRCQRHVIVRSSLEPDSRR